LDQKISNQKKGIPLVFPAEEKYNTKLAESQYYGVNLLWVVSDR